WLTGILSAFFLLVTMYALAEHNVAVTDLALSLLATSSIALIITRICGAVFLRRHPEYRKKATKTTRRGR
ncbi:MAG: guanylate cyclase, partial [Raoultibacter sp.]